MTTQPKRLKLMQSVALTTIEITLITPNAIFKLWPVNETPLGNTD
jgi:hypothetical protein